MKKGLKTGFGTDSRKLLMALLVVAAAVTVYGLAQAAVVSHTPEQIAPQGPGSGLDSDTLWGLTSTEILAAVGGGSGQMPLQGTITYAPALTAIASVPLSLPKAGCSVKITACGSTTAPSQLLIGADPIVRVTKPATNEEPFTSKTDVYYAGNRYQVTDFAGGVYLIVYSDYSSSYDMIYLCPAGYQPTGSYSCNDDGYCPYYNSFKNSCVQCQSGYTWDNSNQVCWKSPRCSSALAGEVGIGFSSSEHTCIYCKSDHPTYDAASRSCTKDTTVNTISQGNCATFSTVLETASTDLTFKSGGSYFTINYAAVAYSCPS